MSAAVPEHRRDIAFFLRLRHQSVQIPLDLRIGLKIALNVLRRLLLRDGEILAESKGADSVDDTKIDRLGIAALQIGHFVKRDVEYLRRRRPVNILCIPVCLDELLIPGQMRQYAQLDLGIIRIHKHKTGLWQKCLADQSSQLNPHRDVLEVRLRAAKASRRRDGLIE